MSFINLKLVNIFHSKEKECNITINPVNITCIKVENDKVLVRTKLRMEYFYISNGEYEEKIKHLFGNGTLDLSFGKIFIKDVECYWNVDSQHYLQMSWSDVRIEITKKDYDKITEVIQLNNSNMLELLDSGELFKFSHNNIREYLYWRGKDGIGTYIKNLSDKHLTNLIDFLKHTTVKSDCDEKWIKVLNNEIEFRKNT